MVPALHWRPVSQSSSIWQTSPSPCLQDQNARTSSAVPRNVPSRNFIRGVNSTGVSPLTSDRAPGLPEVACSLLLRATNDRGRRNLLRGAQALRALRARRGGGARPAGAARPPLLPGDRGGLLRAAGRAR